MVSPSLPPVCRSPRGRAWPSFWGSPPASGEGRARCPGPPRMSPESTRPCTPNTGHANGVDPLAVTCRTRDTRRRWRFPDAGLDRGATREGALIVTSFVLGIDIGTSCTAAAIGRRRADGSVDVEPLELGSRKAAVPTVVYLGDDGGVVVGEAAERRAIDSPDRVVREFKRRIGDETPIIVGDLSVAAQDLFAVLAQWVVERAEEHEGEAPSLITVSHPASWGEHRLGLVRAALGGVGLGGVVFVSEPEAAGLHYLERERVETGQAIAVYDLGGGTFDVAILRKQEDDAFRADRGSHGARTPRRRRLRPADLRACAGAGRHGVRRRRRAPTRRGARAGAGAARLRGCEGGALVRRGDGRARAPARCPGACSARALRVRADDRRRPPAHGRDAAPCRGGGGPRARRTHRRPPHRRVVADPCDRTAHLGRTRAPGRRRRRSQGLDQHGRRGGRRAHRPVRTGRGGHRRRAGGRACRRRRPRIRRCTGRRVRRRPSAASHVHRTAGDRARRRRRRAARGAHPDHAPGDGHAGAARRRHGGHLRRAERRAGRPVLHRRGTAAPPGRTGLPARRGLLRRRERARRRGAAGPPALAGQRRRRRCARARTERILHGRGGGVADGHHPGHRPRGRPGSRARPVTPAGSRPDAGAGARSGARSHTRPRT